jgi:hypothetical protein
MVERLDQLPRSLGHAKVGHEHDGWKEPAGFQSLRRPRRGQGRPVRAHATRV